MPVLTGSVHADILTKPSRAGFAVIRLELMEPGSETCVCQAKACSPTDQPVRKFKDGLGINMTMKTFFTLTCHIMHAQQQLPRYLEVERAAIGQRCRPQSFGDVQRSYIDGFISVKLHLCCFRAKNKRSVMACH